MNRSARFALVPAALAIGAGAQGQSLMRLEAPAPATIEAQVEPLQGMSLYALEPKQERTFSTNDLVTILVSETTNMQREQTLEAKKNYDNRFQMIEWPELRQFLTHLSGPTNASTFGASPLASNRTNFKGEGDYERKDRITARVTARVLEVKPNGTLLLEAKTTVTTDREVQVITLSGLCRTEDITEQNTVVSNLLFNLSLNVQHEGEMARTSRKGLIPRVLETLFNF
jgi:flagellar L-ring protein FlgH